MLFGCFFNSHFVFVSGKHISFLNACAFGFAVIIYTTIVGDNGCVDIPTDILGEVELRLYRGNMMYHAIVEL